jgi:hypothetical protein
MLLSFIQVEEELEVYLKQDTPTFNRKKGNAVPLNVNSFLYKRENTVTWRALK